MKYLKYFSIDESINVDDINDITQSLHDMGFETSVEIFWSSLDYLPVSKNVKSINTTKYKTKHPGTRVSYSIKCKKVGLSVEQCIGVFEEAQTAIDRLSDIGKVYPNVVTNTEKDGTLTINIVMELITPEVILRKDLILEELTKRKCTILPSPEGSIWVLAQPSYHDKQKSTDDAKSGKYAGVMKNRKTIAKNLHTALVNHNANVYSELTFAYRGPVGYQNDYSILVIRLRKKGEKSKDKTKSAL